MSITTSLDAKSNNDRIMIIKTAVCLVKSQSYFKFVNPDEIIKST